MRTKTLVLTAALAAAGAASAMAQNVYSVNAVGYINKTIQLNYSLLAAPFVVPSYSLDALLPSPVNNLAVYKPVGNSFDVRFYAVSDGFWDPDGALTIDPGDGVIVFNDPSPARGTGAPFTVTFVGEVRQSVGGAALTTPIHAGQQIKSSLVPQAGAITAVLGFNPTANVRADQIGADGLSFADPKFYAVSDGFWDPEEPVLDFAQGVYLNSVADQSWSRVFTVN
jgi:hypothetical protein